MNLIKNKILHSCTAALTVLFFQATAQAQPIIVPGFMVVESSYLEAPESSAHSTLAYFTIANLHDEPIILLGASSDISESATLNGPGHEELESIVIQPSERLIMGSDGFHVHFDELDSSIDSGDAQEITLLVRRGLEALEEVEAQERNANNGIRARRAGIPNEHDIVVRVPVRN
ncbi:MAG: copper chaperone PCu(A)C [Gammaproteobacteria bacterium]|jgi:copper(I)-binding protein|nr:copper chaperone PCu(A)C [Gammaproteobacteria bacterium]